MDILILSDLHYTPDSDGMDLQRNDCLTPVMIQKALRRLRQKQIEPDLILMLGDLLEEGEHQEAGKRLESLAGTLASCAIPFLVVGGNHDGSPERVAEIFSTPAGLHRIGEYGFVVFSDRYDACDHTSRSAEQMELLRNIRRENPDLPLIALQHSPIHPDIELKYPYMPDNVEAIRFGYEEAGVLLSLSGHYHPGQPLHQHQGVWYYTTPALSEHPFTFTHLRISDATVAAEEFHLALDTPGLMDAHCHSEYAYCAQDISAFDNRLLAHRLGLRTLALTEHAFHLYFPNKQAWSYAWQHDPTLRADLNNNEFSRMAEYKKWIEPFRGDGVVLGLELDLCDDDTLLLADEDREGWDLFLGSVHRIPGVDGNTADQLTAEQAFMDQVERLCRQPIRVLTHPFRWFVRSNGNLERPPHLFEPVAEILAATGIAAEINYHTNSPDPRFIEACLERGVKIALGTDSHALEEVADLWPHLDLLREVGVSEKALPDVLFQL